MASRIYAFVEYDDSAIFNPAANGREPFSVVPEAIDFTNYTRLFGGKDYRFFGAISGIRNGTQEQPLYPLRGLPPNISSEAQGGLDQYFDEKDSGLGWLTLPEIEAALGHMGYLREDMSLAVNVVLEVMGYLETKLGAGRVRLVFGIH